MIGHSYVLGVELHVPAWVTVLIRTIDPEAPPLGLSKGLTPEEQLLLFDPADHEESRMVKYYYMNWWDDPGTAKLDVHWFWENMQIRDQALFDFQVGAAIR